MPGDRQQKNQSNEFERYCRVTRQLSTWQFLERKINVTLKASPIGFRPLLLLAHLNRFIFVIISFLNKFVCQTYTNY